MILVDGDHNSARPEYMFDSATIFFLNCLYEKDEVKGELTSNGFDTFDIQSPFFVYFFFCRKS